MYHIATYRYTFFLKNNKRRILMLILLLLIKIINNIYNSRLRIYCLIYLFIFCLSSFFCLGLVGRSLRSLSKHWGEGVVVPPLNAVHTPYPSLWVYNLTGMVNCGARSKKGGRPEGETPLYSLPPQLVAVSTPKEHHFPG